MVTLGIPSALQVAKTLPLPACLTCHQNASPQSRTSCHQGALALLNSTAVLTHRDLVASTQRGSLPPPRPTLRVSSLQTPFRTSVP